MSCREPIIASIGKAGVPTRSPEVLLKVQDADPIRL